MSSQNFGTCIDPCYRRGGTQEYEVGNSRHDFTPRDMVEEKIDKYPNVKFKNPRSPRFSKYYSQGSQKKGSDTEMRQASPRGSQMTRVTKLNVQPKSKSISSAGKKQPVKRDFQTKMKERHKSIFYWDRMKHFNDMSTTADSKSEVSEISINDFTNMTTTQKLMVADVWEKIKKEDIKALLTVWMLECMPDTIHVFEDCRGCRDADARSSQDSDRSDVIKRSPQDRMLEHSRKVVEEIDELVDVLHTPHEFQQRVIRLAQLHKSLTPPVGDHYMGTWALAFTDCVSRLLKIPVDSDVMCVWSLFVQLVCVPQEVEKKMSQESTVSACCCVIL